MRSRRAGIALIAAGAAAVAAVPAVSGAASHATAAAKKPVKRTVHVADYYFSPTKLSVPRKSTISFKWPSADNAGDTHNVKLKKGPKGVKHWRSQDASSSYTYKRKLSKKGKYVFICTYHPYMTTTIRVK